MEKHLEELIIEEVEFVSRKMCKKCLSTKCFAK